MRELASRVVIVTGGASGIGAAATRAFAATVSAPRITRR